MNARKPQITEHVNPNLIPMIDIMFLLLLFFMLGADMSQRQMEEVVLASASEIKEDKPQPGIIDTTLIINVHHVTDRGSSCPIYAAGGVCREPGHWQWGIHGRDYDKTTLKEQLALEAQREMEDKVDEQAHKILSKRKVLIRADSGAPYGDVQKIIEICGTVSIYKIEVGAAKPAPTNLK